MQNVALPVIAILTPTKGRRQHLEFQVEQMKLVNYPREKIRWIITDTETAEGEWHWARITAMYENAYYIPLPMATSLGKSRNIGIEEALKTDAEFIFLQDDDDIICQERFEKAINFFRANPSMSLVGCSAVLCYNLRSENLIQIGSYGLCHSLEPTLAFTRAYAETHQFDDEDRRGRLGPFLGNFTIPIIQMNAKDCCVIIGHNENTFDKYQLEEMHNEDFNTFKIKSIHNVPLSSLCRVFNLSNRMEKLFRKAYEKELRDNMHMSKSQRFLIKLKEQYAEGVIGKEYYLRAKEFLEKNENSRAILECTMLENLEEYMDENDVSIRA
jgi:hypothetical protein